jgi:hypothetical protein
MNGMDGWMLPTIYCKYVLNNILDMMYPSHRCGHGIYQPHTLNLSKLSHDGECFMMIELPEKRSAFTSPLLLCKQGVFVRANIIQISGFTCLQPWSL